MKDAVATMGTILEPDVGGRDAVHVAVVSAVAGQKLTPGQDVGLQSRHASECLALTSETHIGIVDPFLKEMVWPDQRFWLYLYPRTITSLRHNWTHPAFEDAGGTYSPPTQKLASEKWMREFSEGYGVTPDRMVEAARGFIKHGDYFSQGGTFEGERVPDEFWDHYQRITGELVDTDTRGSFFTCSC